MLKTNRLKNQTHILKTTQTKKNLCVVQVPKTKMHLISRKLMQSRKKSSLREQLLQQDDWYKEPWLSKRNNNKDQKNDKKLKLVVSIALMTRLTHLRKLAKNINTTEIIQPQNLNQKIMRTLTILAIWQLKLKTLLSKPCQTQAETSSLEEKKLNFKKIKRKRNYQKEWQKLKS